jgi:polyhydroxybutyrate depolymerase
LRIRPTALAACAAAAAALGPAAAAASAASPCARGAGSGSAQVRVLSSGLRRSALVHVPAGAKTGARLPVVIALHGAGRSGELMERDSGLSAVADRSGFMVVYPSAVAPHPFWNYFNDPDRPKDEQFLADLIRHIQTTRCVDKARFYVTGVSNGGGMAARIGCVLSKRIAAIAPVAGGYARLPACQSSRPVSVLEIHGTADGSAPYENVAPFVRGWVERDECVDKPIVRQLAPKIERRDWVRCLPGARVAHVRIDGGPHEYPGGAATRTPPSSGLSASWAVWRFFANLRRG